MTGPRRLLLLEFVADSPLRNERADFFPFYKGFAEGAGIPARWLCAGARFEGLAISPTEVRNMPVLERGDADALARALAEWAPTHVLVNEEPSPELRRLVKAAAPRAELLLSTEEDCGRGPDARAAFDLIAEREGWGRTASGTAPVVRHDLPLTRFFQTGWLSRWLGLPPGEDRYFVGTVEPSYDAVMLNPQARAFAPFLSILGGVSCDYRADVSRNPLYRGVDLSDCDRRGGCTFCSPAHPPASAPGDDPLELARTQFSAVARAAAAPGRGCGRFNMRDIRLFRRLDEFFDMILALDLPASDFFFAPRIDDLLRAGPAIEGLLPKLAARGHRLSLFRMGIEQFSPRENARFNKGVSAAQIDQGLALAERLKAEHPGRFDYARPLGYIAYTPWTTLEDLELTFREGVKRGFEPQAPWLYSALELNRETPIAALALHEGGIVRKRYDDVALTYGLMADGRSRPGLLPWRMKDRRAAAACGLIVRYCAVSLRGIMPDEVFSSDALYAWLKTRVDARGLGAARPDLFAAEIVGLLKTARPPWNKKKLIRTALERLERRGAHAAGPPQRPAPATEETPAATAAAPERHRHFSRFLEKVLGRSDFFLVGGRGQMKIVLPDAEIIVSPRETRPFVARNRYFSLCFGGGGASEGQARTLRVLDRATERYARRFPWLIRSVQTGSVHLENSPRLFRHLASTANPHTSLFRAFEDIENADENRTGPAAGLFDFEALRGMLFRIVNSIPARDADAADDDAVPGPPLLFPEGLQAVFINMLPEAADVSAELSRWLAGCRGARPVELRAADWREVERYRSPRTIVFCVAADEECLRYLLDNLGRFGRVVIWDAGINREPRAVPDALIRDKRLSLYLTSTINYFGSLYPRLAPERRIPYIPAVTRNILRRRLPAVPERDFFVCANWEQDLTFLFRHERFFSGKKLMVGVKRSQDPRLRRTRGEPLCLETCRKVQKRFPGTVFVPTVPRDMHLYFWQMARNIVIMYPDSWEKTSFSLSTALLSGRGLITSPHPAIAGIDPACILPYSPGARYSDAEMETLFCSDAASRRAARNAARFARRHLEFSRILSAIAAKTLTAAA